LKQLIDSQLLHRPTRSDGTPQPGWLAHRLTALKGGDCAESLSERHLLRSALEALGRLMRDDLPDQAERANCAATLRATAKRIGNAAEPSHTETALNNPAKAEKQGQTKPGESAPQKPRITKEEANLRAREALKGRAPKGNRWSLRALSKAIGCSDGMVPKLPAWQAYREEKGLRKGPAAPKGVTLSDKISETEGKPDEELERLIAEQDADRTADVRQYRRRKHV
jgi:hypothetical protein